MPTVQILPAKKNQFFLLLNGETGHLISKISLPKISGTEANTDDKIILQFSNPIIQVINGDYFTRDIASVANLDSLAIFVYNDTDGVRTIYQKYYFYNLRSIDIENSQFDSNSTDNQTITFTYSFEDYKIQFENVGRAPEILG